MRANWNTFQYTFYYTESLVYKVLSPNLSDHAKLSTRIYLLLHIASMQVIYLTTRLSHMFYRPNYVRLTESSQLSRCRVRIERKSSYILRWRWISNALHFTIPWAISRANLQIAPGDIGPSIGALTNSEICIEIWAIVGHRTSSVLPGYLRGRQAFRATRKGHVRVGWYDSVGREICNNLWRGCVCTEQ